MVLVAIISDIHANLTAMMAVLNDINARFQPDEIWCTGDVVGYYTRPSEVIKLVFGNCTPHCIIKGNHDDAVARETVLEHWNPKAAEAIRWTVKHLNVEERQLLYSLPTMLTLEKNEHKILLIHGGPEYPLEQYIRPDDTDYLEQCVDFMEMVEFDYMFLGHVHVPFVYRSRGKTIVNSGSVGQPRDGNNRACYCLFDSITDEVTFQRVEYDYKETMNGVIENDLPRGLAERLPSGV
ncbi:MAG: metallophosphoesterase family protein [Candidatus Odinarchaeota archaeon]